MELRSEQMRGTALAWHEALRFAFGESALLKRYQKRQ